MTKAFRILMSLVIALPLGAGGLCCCLWGDVPSAAASGEVAVGASSCCAEPGHATPVDRPGADPPGEDEECGCAEREAAVLTPSTSQEPILGLSLALGDLSPASSIVPATPSAAHRVLPPVPPGHKRPLFRTFSVLLC